MMQQKKTFIAYEYKQVSVPGAQASMALDCYECFGWEADGQTVPHESRTVTLYLKRDRKILNRMELTRLQRHFEACAHEIEMLERSVTTAATALAIGVGVVGTAFMTGSVFAVTHEPPILWLCVLLALPGFAGWVAPLPLFRHIAARKEQQVQPLIEAKRDELYEICEKGSALL